VSISGDAIVVGAHRDDDKGTDSGSAYVFTRDVPGSAASAWTKRAKLVPADGAESDQFGYSVSISGDAIVVGAYGDDDKGSSSGSAYVFTSVPGSSASVWTQRAKLVAADGAADDDFGASVSISGATIVVGARYDDDKGLSSGSAYVISTETSTETSVNVGSDYVDSDYFGPSPYSFIEIGHGLDNPTLLCSNNKESSIGGDLNIVGDIYLGATNYTGSAGYITHSGGDGFMRLKTAGSSVTDSNDVVLRTGLTSVGCNFPGRVTMSNNFVESYYNIDHKYGYIRVYGDVNRNTGDYSRTTVIRGGDTSGSDFSHDIRINGAVELSSDDRLKVNEDAIVGASDALMKLRPQVYDKLRSIGGDESKSMKEAGLIAQEIWYDCPELRHLVTIGRSYGESKEEAEGNVEADVEIPEDPRDDPDYSSWGPKPASVNYTGFIAYLIRGFQEQQELISTMSETLKRQQEEINALKG
jgi:hypothetical protein